VNNPAHAEALIALPAPRAAAVELLAPPGSLAEQLQEFAALPASPNTRRAYRGACEAFLAFLTARHGGQTPSQFTASELAGWRDWMIAAGAAPASVAQRLTAARRFAAHLGLDAAIQQVKATGVQALPSPALSGTELARLLAMPDLRTRRGKRDLALLHLLSSCGLRRAEASTLKLQDIRQVRRASDPRRPAAIAERPAQRTGFEVVVRHTKRGRSRTVPINRPALQALQAWYQARPPVPEDWLLLAFPRGRPPARLTGAQIGRIVARHAEKASLIPDHRTPHALRHTFCTRLAERGVGLDVIQVLAGHADIRTTSRYLHVDHQRLEAAVDVLSHEPHPLLTADG
jgi:integrase/recombinase XerD